MSLPTIWQTSELKNTLELIIDHRGITPKKLGGDWVEKGIPAISAMNINSGKLIRPEEIRYVDSKMYDKWMPEKLKKSDILLTSEAPLGEVYYVENPNFCLSQRLFGLRAKENILNSKYLYYYLISNEGQKRLHERSTGTTVKGIRQTELVKISIILPTLSEQQKIASILSNVDSLINQTQKEIEQTQRLKKGLLQALLTEGIGHKKFKKINLGKPLLSMEIPVEWDLKPIDEVLSTISNPIRLDDDKQYTRITVKRRNGGIVLRDVEYGKNIKVERQHEIRSGDFIISNKQIIHNACGIIPAEFDGSVVSIEYTILRGSDLLDMAFMNLFSYTNLFKKMIILTTQGVHLEKYVFLIAEWLKLKIPLPSIKEQKKIVEIIENCESKISQYVKHKSQLETIKKGLMQKLLTGQMRVKI